MAEQPPQNYGNHRRLDPVYHYVAFGILAAYLVQSLIALVRAPSMDHVWQLLVSVALILLLGKVRSYALHNQDRLIRLEETLRMERLLPEALRPRIQELNPGQIVSLRFASDQELASLVEQTLAENLDREAIKKRIQTWRADTFRV